MVKCPDCQSTDVEELGLPCNGEQEYQCQACEYTFWSDEADTIQ